jgi:putative SOS response-associated peptidase YedK
MMRMEPKGTCDSMPKVWSMCGRFVSATEPDELAKYFGAAPPEALLPENYNVAPTVDIYALVGDTSGEVDIASSAAAEPANLPAPERRMETFYWGLVPMWAKEQKVSYRMINARAETVATKNSFRSAFKRRRCLIPATGKDEKGKPKKQPYFIHRPDGEPLAMAGLWERWLGPDKDWDQALHSATIITTEANDFMSDLHDRMPVFLPPHRWDEWLDPQNDDTESLQELLVPAGPGLLDAHMVDPKVGNVGNRGPELIDPFTPDPTLG